MLSNEQLDDLPQFQKITFTSLSIKATYAALVQSLLVYLLIVTVALGIHYKKPFLQFVIEPWSIFTILLIITLLTLYIVLKYRNKGVALREQDIAFKKGIFWKKITILPFNRIQHLESHRGPIDRKFDLATLRLYTAGGAQADMIISGLDVMNADQIKQLLLDKINQSNHHA